MITPNRRTIFQMDIGEVSVLRPLWDHKRTANKLGGQVLRGAPASDGVTLLPGGAWALQPDRGELIQSIRQDYHDSVIDGATGAVMDMAPGIEVVKTFAKNVLPGMGTAADVVTSGVPAFIKRVAQGQLFDACVLAADAAAFPGPTEPIAQSIPLDRVLAGKVSYGENTGFTVVFGGMEGTVGADAILRFYFGGAAAVTPLAAKGGQFCLSVRGNGKVVLWERNAAGGWDARYSTQWSEPHRASDNIHAISVTPYGRDRLAIISQGSAINVVTVNTPFLGLPLVSATATEGPKHPSFWQDLPGTTGHQHRRSLTGNGIIRLDIRRDYRERIVLKRHKYPAEGHLTDAPVVIARDLPAGTPITLRAETYTLPGTSIEGVLYDATTHAPLASPSTGVFLSNAGQRAYYARFTFSTTDRYQTPILFARNIGVAEEYQTHLSVPQIFPSTDHGAIRSVQISGAGTTPETENATLSITDPLDEAPVLRVRGDLRCLISVQDTNTGAIIAHLFEGRTVRSPAHLRGKPGTEFPSPEWREYPALRLVGMWAQLAEQFSQGLWDLGKVSNGSTDPYTGMLALLDRKVTDVIRLLFNNAGVPDDELDIPDLPYVLTQSDSISQEDYLVAYGCDFSKLIVTLSRDYLGRLIVRDPCAGPRGMWRMLPNPVPPYGNHLAIFAKGEPPLDDDVFPIAESAYGSDWGYVQDGTWDSWVLPPEVNDLVVVGTVKPGAGGDGEESFWQHMRNEVSISGSRTDPDYVGRVKPFAHGPDPGLQTQAAVDAYIKRVYQRGAHAEKWVAFRAPLLLIQNVADPHQVLRRPLRINDLVYVYDQGVYTDAVVFSCEPDYSESDTLQMARYELLILVDWPEGEMLVR